MYLKLNQFPLIVSEFLEIYTDLHMIAHKIYVFSPNLKVFIYKSLEFTPIL